MCNNSCCKCQEQSSSKPHVHAESMKLYAEDAAETDKPWERWEGKHSWCAKEVGYTPLVGHPEWSKSVLYRRKRKTRVINGPDFFMCGIDPSS